MGNSKQTCRLVGRRRRPFSNRTRSAAAGRPIGRAAASEGSPAGRASEAARRALNIIYRYIGLLSQARFSTVVKGVYEKHDLPKFHLDLSFFLLGVRSSALDMS